MAWQFYVDVDGINFNVLGIDSNTGDLFLRTNVVSFERTLCTFL